jgi:hypothetical protein
MKRKVFIVKQKQLADGSILQSIIAATKPGAKKMQFPYDLPTVNVSLTDDTKNALYTSVGILAGGFVLGKVAEKFL